KGAMIDLIRLRNSSEIGLRLTPTLGASQPTSTPIPRPMKICVVRESRKGKVFMQRLGNDCVGEHPREVASGISESPADCKAGRWTRSLLESRLQAVIEISIQDSRTG